MRGRGGGSVEEGRRAHASAGNATFCEHGARCLLQRLLQHVPSRSRLQHRRYIDDVNRARPGPPRHVPWVDLGPAAVPAGPGAPAVGPPGAACGRRPTPPDGFTAATGRSRPFLYKCCRSPTSSTSSEKHTPHLRPPGGAHVHFPRHPPPSTIHLTPRYHSLRAIHLPHSARSTSPRAIHLTGSTSATRTRRSQPDATCSGARLGATGYDVDTACARRRAGPWASSTLALRRLAFIVGAPHAPPPGR